MSSPTITVYSPTSWDDTTCDTYRQDPARQRRKDARALDMARDKRLLGVVTLDRGQDADVYRRILGQFTKAVKKQGQWVPNRQIMNILKIELAGGEEFHGDVLEETLYELGYHRWGPWLKFTKKLPFDKDMRFRAWFSQGNRIFEDYLFNKGAQHPDVKNEGADLQAYYKALALVSGPVKDGVPEKEIPLRFKIAQAELFRCRDKVRLQEAFRLQRLPDGTRRPDYRSLVLELDGLYIAKINADSVIDGVLGLLERQRLQIQSRAEDVKEAFDDFLHRLPKLKKVKEAVLEMDVAKAKPDVRDQIKKIDTKFKDPTTFVASVAHILLLIHKLESPHQPLKVSLELSKQLGLLEKLRDQLPDLRASYREKQAFDTVSKLVDDIAELRGKWRASALACNA